MLAGVKCGGGSSQFGVGTNMAHKNRKQSARRKNPKARSRCWRDNRWASETPKRVVKIDVGMVRAKVASDTKPIASDGRSG